MAVLTTMQCPICKATDGFSASEYVMPYRTGTVRAPALECLACGAIVLDEVASHIDKDLECVRQAQCGVRKVLECLIMTERGSSKNGKCSHRR